MNYITKIYNNIYNTKFSSKYFQFRNLMEQAIIKACRASMRLMMSG